MIRHNQACSLHLRGPIHDVQDFSFSYHIAIQMPSTHTKQRTDLQVFMIA